MYFSNRPNLTQFENLFETFEFRFCLKSGLNPRHPALCHPGPRVGASSPPSLSSRSPPHPAADTGSPTRSSPRVSRPRPPPFLFTRQHRRPRLMARGHCQQSRTADRCTKPPLVPPPPSPHGCSRRAPIPSSFLPRATEPPSKEKHQSPFLSPLSLLFFGRMSSPDPLVLLSDVDDWSATGDGKFGATGATLPAPR
jgi:hypothetical protein